MRKSELEILEEKIVELKRKQNTCNHDWEEPQNDVTKEPIYENKRYGVDMWPEIVGYRDVPCWVRFCKKCGKKEIATEFEEVEVVVKKEMRPKFRPF